MSRLRSVVGLVRRRERGDASWIARLADIEHPDELFAIFLMLQYCLIERDRQITIRMRQAVVDASTARRRPVSMGD